MEVVGTSKLNLFYGDGDLQVHALKDIDLSIKSSELVSIMGPSGSGKSSLLHVLGAMLTSSQGDVRIEGKNISAMSSNQLASIRRNHFGFVFQNFALFPSLNALENVQTPLYPINPPWLKERAAELLDRVGLENRYHHKPNQLSGGEIQRVAIARALINKPSVIFGDEITGNLDTTTGRDIFDLIQELNSEGITFIIVTHDEKIDSYCERSLKMLDGRFII